MCSVQIESVTNTTSSYNTTFPTLTESSAIREASFCDRVLEAAPLSIKVDSWLIALGFGGLQTCTCRREENRTQYHCANMYTDQDSKWQDGKDKMDKDRILKNKMITDRMSKNKTLPTKLQSACSIQEFRPTKLHALGVILIHLSAYSFSHTHTQQEWRFLMHNM